MYKSYNFSNFARFTIGLFIAVLLYTGSGSVILQSYLDKKAYNTEKYIAPTIRDGSDYSENSTSKKMSTDGIPFSDNFCWLLPDFSSTFDNTFGKSRKAGFSDFKVNLQIHNKVTKLNSLTSFALVSSTLGRQFTLVGAKPSGTS